MRTYLKALAATLAIVGINEGKLYSPKHPVTLSNSNLSIT